MPTYPRDKNHLYIVWNPDAVQPKQAFVHGLYKSRSDANYIAQKLDYDRITPVHDKVIAHILTSMFAELMEKGI